MKSRERLHTATNSVERELKDGGKRYKGKLARRYDEKIDRKEWKRIKRSAWGGEWGEVVWSAMGCGDPERRQIRS